MKPMVLAGVAVLATILVSGPALADRDCVDPVGEWQSRDVLRQKLEQRGWKVKRIKEDDGCYEVKGTDRLGNKFKAKYGPASLRIRELEIDFGEDGDGGGEASDYLDQNPDNDRKSN